MGGFPLTSLRINSTEREKDLKLKGEAIITKEKITDYLLKWRPDNDKSQYLNQAGYTQTGWRNLLEDIRNQILPLDAEFLQSTVYGGLWRIRGTLKGPNGVAIRVVTIWMHEEYTGLTKFITLFPDKEG